MPVIVLISRRDLSIRNATTFVISQAATSTTSSVPAVIQGVAPVLVSTITTTTANSSAATVPAALFPSLYVGMVIVATTVPSGAYIQALSGTNSVTLSVSTGVTVGTNTAAVFVGQNCLALKSEMQDIDITSGVDVLTVSSTSGIVLGQRIVASPFPSGTYVKEILSDTTLKLSAASTTGLYDATVTFGPVVAISKNLTAAATATAVSFSPVIEMAAAASASSAAASFTFTSNGRTMADMRDGDYCTVAIRVTSAGGYEAYLMGYGYLRKASSATKQFFLWDREIGGSPVTALIIPTNVNFFWGVSDGPHVVAIYQRPKIRFERPDSAGIKGRLAEPVALEYAPRGMHFNFQKLNGRLVTNPVMHGLDADWYIGFKPVYLSSRLAAQPDIRSIERSIPFDPRHTTGRMNVPPRFTGGYLRAIAFSRGRVYHEPLAMSSSPESIYFRQPAHLYGHATGRLGGAEDFRRHPHVIRALVSGGSDFVIVGRGLSVRDVAADCLGVWNMRLPARNGGVQDDVKERIVSDINAAMQTIYSRARRLDYFNRSTHTLQVNAGERTKTLPKTVQTVLGTVRLRTSDEAQDSTPLFALGSLAEVMQFSTLYGGAGTVPIAYYIDRRTQPEANVVKAAVMLAPVPASTVYVDLEVASEAPRYTWRDVELATPLQLPSTYAESLLIPIVRQRATTFRLFSNDSLRPSIEAHYQKSMLALGLLDTAPNQAAALQTNDVGGRE